MKLELSTIRLLLHVERNMEVVRLLHHALESAEASVVRVGRAPGGCRGDLSRLARPAAARGEGEKNATVLLYSR